MHDHISETDLSSVQARATVVPTAAVVDRPRRPPSSPAQLLSAWEGEVDAFLAALDTESDCGNDDDSVSTTSASDSSSTTVWEADSLAPFAALLPLAVPAKSKFSSSHARQKYEKNLLLKQIAALEEAIRRLAPPTSPAQESMLTQSVAEWKQAALTQRELLQRARKQNTRLRRRALEQKHLAKGLQRILLRRVTNNQMMEERLSTIPSCLRIDEPVSPDDDRAMFAKSVVDVDRMARSANTALGILQRETPSHGATSKWEIALDAGERVYLRLVFTFEVPYKKVDVDDAVGLLRTKAPQNARGFDPRRVGGSPDMIMMKTSDQYVTPVERGVYLAHLANQWFVVDDTRTLMLSVSYVKATTGSGPDPGMDLKSQQWLVLTQRTHADPRTGATRQSTLVQFFSTISLASAYPGRWRRDVAESVVVPVWERECAQGQQDIEDVLLDQARNGRH